MVKLNVISGIASSAFILLAVSLIFYFANLYDQLHGNEQFGSGSTISTSMISSSGVTQERKSVTIIQNQQLLPRTAGSDVFAFMQKNGMVKNLSLSGSITDAKIKIVATTKESSQYPHDSYIGFAFVIVDTHGKEPLNGNYLDSEWIGNNQKILSRSRSNGLILPGERRTFNYDLSSIPVSKNSDRQNNLYPPGIQHFDLQTLLINSKGKDIQFAIFPSQVDFGVIELVEIQYSGSGTIVVH